MLGERGELLHRLALRGQLQAGFLAGFRLAVEGLRNRRGASHFAQQQNLDLKLAAVVADRQHVACTHVAGGFGLDSVGVDAAQVTGLRSERSGLEEARGPQPFVDAHGGHGYDRS